MAEDEYRYARIRFAEPGVTIQRASESVADEAEANLPFLPGDRVFTNQAGRVEFQFADGSVTRVDRVSKLEYVSAEDRAPNVLRLHSGSLFLHVRGADPGFEVETPEGLVETRARGVFRVDVDGEEVRLFVYEGEGSLAAGRRRVHVEEGEMASARQRQEPDEPQRFDRRDQDEFARWDEGRAGRGAWAGEHRQYVPQEVEAYADDLDSHGSWYYEAEAGYVWRPYVAADWRPYNNGRWIWTAYGWTWIPGESWGWATCHYGRWDHSEGLGWYWVPGRSWGPAWVHWAVGTNYVGWSPLGYHDRVVSYARGGGARGDYAVPRSSSGAWVYAQRDQMGARFAARRPVAAGVATQEVRAIEAPLSRPSRDLRTVEAGVARPAFRGTARAGSGAPVVRTKPTIGDTVPELRSDNSTTIPAPVVRRHSDSLYDERPATAGPRPGGSSFSGVDPALRNREVTPRYGAPVRPTGSGTPSRPTTTSNPSSSSDRPPRVDRDVDRSRANERPPDPDRDVLRRMFRPVTGSSTGAAREHEAPPRTGSARGDQPPSASGAPEKRDDDRSRGSESRPPQSHPSAGSRSEPKSASPPHTESHAGPAEHHTPPTEHRSAPAEHHPPKEHQ
jgi:hypothetical protein